MKLNKVVIKFLFLFYCSTLAPSCSHVHHKEEFIGGISYQKVSGDSLSLFLDKPSNTNLLHVISAKANQNFVSNSTIFTNRNNFQFNYSIIF